MTWQRVESSTIDDDLEWGLEARVADPLWFLARQWQVGEFRGEDAAIPVFVALTARSVELSHVQPGMPADGQMITTRGPASPPLEAAIEAESLADIAARVRLGVEVADLLIGALRTDTRIGADPFRRIVDRLRDDFPAVVPDDADGIEPDPVGRRRLRALARRSFDASDLIARFVADPAGAAAWIQSIDVSARARAALLEIGARWAALLADVFVGPLGDGAWNTSRMEYEGSVGAALDDAGSGIALTLRDYGGGRLDWYSFDYLGAQLRGDPGGAATADAEQAESKRVQHYATELIPQPLTFAGMPASRFWEFESGEVHFGGIDAAPEDLAKLSLAAYATVYGDDWYVVPLTVAAGTIVTIDTVTVIDDFGDATVVPSAASLDGASRSFKWFELTGDPSAELGREPLLFVPPTVDTADGGTILDDLRVVRDEMANTAWAIERRVLDRSGRPVDPIAALGTPPRAEAPTGPTSWSFRIGAEVPANWVPMVPVRLGQGGAIGLQRGRMPVPGGGTRGATGDLLEPRQRLVVEESEVPSVGLRVIRRFQSARSTAGGFHVWLGRQKGPGRGEGDSGLVFDHLDIAPRDDDQP